MIRRYLTKSAGPRTSYFAWLLLLLATICPKATAVPSYARQTGLSCNVCHSNPPELTAFGRKFKLNAYTLTDLRPDTSVDAKNLAINRYFPLSAMMVVADTAIHTHTPETQNGSVQFPQIMSMFLAGAFATHMGGQVQATYSHQSDHFTLDNTDLRFADHATLHSKELIYGATLNNSPTMEDLWNSTPSWGYPWVSPTTAPSPIAKPVLLGALAQDVAGLGAYAMWDNHLYASLSAYRSEHVGGSQPVDGTGHPYNIQGVAPYWRAAWQQYWGNNNYLMVGTYGIYLSSTPGGVGGTRDTYMDPAVDFQYERPFSRNLLTVHGTYVHESSKLHATFESGGAAGPDHHLDSIRTDVNYHIRERLRLTAAGFSTTGSNDPILYAPAPVIGSVLGSPQTTGYIAQAGFWAKQNIELSFQYTGYGKFNGSSKNYDGFGRNASANNTAFIALWVSY